MNSKRSKIMQVMIVAVVLIGLLTAGLPLVAQNETPLQVEMKQFLENRIRTPGQFERFNIPSRSIRYHPDAASIPQGLQIWDDEVVENNYSLGWGLSLVLDQSEYPHISYVDFGKNTVKYAYQDGTAWQILTISESSGAGYWTSLALDSHNRPHIVYSSGGYFKYSFYDGETWHVKALGNAGGDADYGGSIVIDVNDHPHISYLDSTTNDLMYGYFDGTQWHLETVAHTTESGRSASMALDTLGNPHIAYRLYASKLKYATKNNGSWSIQTIDDTGTLRGGQLVLDVSNRPSISYFDSVGNAGHQTTLKYASYNGAQWTIQSVDYSQDLMGWNTYLQIDRNGHAHISYTFLEEGTTDTKYAHFNGSTWQLEKPIFFNGAGLAAMRLDHSDRPHFAYNYAGVKYAIKLTDPVDWSQLAFASYRDNNWEVYTASANGTNQARRTFDSHYDSTPKMNRGASQVAFVSARNGNYEIYAMRTDGSGQVRLTNTSAQEYWPTWSPDGSKIAFYSYRDGNAEIYVMNANGSNQTRLTMSLSWDGHPAWSPDGTQLIFVSDRGGTSDLWIMKADGSNQHQLTYGLNAAYPDWSPDGNRIIFNDDTNNDEWLDVAIIKADGTSLTHPLGYSPANYDYAAPTWAPSGQDYAFAKTQWIYYQGNYYWVDAYLYGISGGLIYQLTNSGLDWWPNWQTTDIRSPSSQVNTLPALLNAIQFKVNWLSIDTGASGIMSYDIQYRDGANGTWTDWLTTTNQTSAVFHGQYGHTYYFRSRARDYANNLEAYPSSPDTMTTIYQHTTSGQVLDNRDQPVAVVSVQTNPAALNNSFSNHDGTYDLYFAEGGVYTLTATRSNFGQLPPLLNVTVPNSNSLPTLYLPPLDNQISDSHFESGDLSTWNPSGASDDLTPTITSTVHTSLGAVVLGGSVPTDTLTSGPWHSAIEQTINVSPTNVSGTLSLLYRVESAEPVSDTLAIYVTGVSNTLTLSLPLTVSEWTHTWFDLSTWNEPTATVKIDFALADTGREATIIFDEITWGSAIEGSHTVFLPIARR